MIKENNRKKIDVFSSYDDSIQPEKLFLYLYNEFCKSYSIYTTINVEPFLKKITEQYKITNENFILKDEASKSKKIEEIDYNSSSYLIKIREKFFIEVTNYKVVFYYSQKLAENDIKKIRDIINLSKKTKKHKKKFYMISANNHSEYGFDFKKFNIKKQDVNIKDNYNDDFIETDKIINSFLGNGKNNGLIILHGKYGTGKTSYIRSLMNAINKRFIFLPLNMMESISSPNFLPFISQYKNSVLVLEDCETLLKARSSGNSDNSLVNLLNLGDGLLSDALSIKIVCTFNADLKEIDRAILRKGRLVARYEFKELEIEKANALSKKIKNDIEYKKPTTLAEIYNNNKKDFSKLDKNKKIGF